MRKKTIGCMALLAVGAWACDNQGFDEAVARRGAAIKAAAPNKAKAPKPAARAVIAADDRKAYKVLPAVFANPDNPVTDAKVNLGRMLYFEKRLSKNHDVSCNSCHALDKYGVDNEATSPGHRGQRGGRNSPTVYNAGGYLAQFWDGRAKDLEAQAVGPITNPIEMAMPDEKTVIKTIQSMPEYVKAFKEAFPKDDKALNFANIGRAIAAFERKLVTPGRFDDWLQGNENALSDQEVRGFATFIKLGCPTCHVGEAIGGTTFQKLGLVKPWPDTSDLGRYEVTKDDSDKMKFRVPSLRNIEKTGPYFHKGQVKSLQEVVRLMAWHQLGQKLKKEQLQDVVAFLKSLTGKLPGKYIQEPALPKSTKDTVAADPT